MYDPDVVSWLLSEENPPVRYLTVRDVVGRRVTEGALIAMRDAISTWEPLARILALQRADGSFSSNGNPLDARRTLWALLLMQRCGSISPTSP